MTKSGVLRCCLIVCLVFVLLPLMSIEVFGATFVPLPKGTYVDAGDFTSLNAAVAASAGKTLLVGKATRLSGNLSIPADVSLIVVKGGSILAGPSSILDIRGPFAAGLYQVFSGFRAGGVRFHDRAVKEVYPQWWGQDNSASIQSALESYNNVVLPKGIYMIDTQIRIPSNTTLRGEPRSILKRPDRTAYPDASMVVNENFHADLVSRKDTGIVIDGITVDGNKGGRQTTPANGIYLRSAQNVRVKNVTVYRCGQTKSTGAGSGILFTNVLNGVIENCTSHSNDGDGIIMYVKNINVLVQSCITYGNYVIGIEVEGRLNTDYINYRNKGIAIDGCVAYSNGGDGHYGHGILVDWSDAVTVTGNVVTENKIWLGAINILGCTGVTITGNSVWKNVFEPGTPYPKAGIVLYPQIYGAAGFSRNVVISNNTIDENQEGIYLRDCGDMTVTGNTIKSSALAATGIEVYGTCENVVLKNNVIKVGPNGNGMILSKGLKAIMIEGNAVAGGLNGISFVTRGEYYDLNIQGNVISHAFHGISAAAGTRIMSGRISNNFFRDIAKTDLYGAAAGPVVLSSFFVQDNVYDKGILNWNSVGVRPTTGTWKQGDRIVNPQPSVEGNAADTYVVTGWLCVESGTPGKWVSMISPVRR